MPQFFPIIFVHGWGGVSDLVRDFDDRDERDPYAGWNEGRRYNDPDGWVKFRDTQPNFEGLVLRMVKDFNYYEASNDEDLDIYKGTLKTSNPKGLDLKREPSNQEAALKKSLWIFRYYEYNAEHMKLDPAVEKGIAAELKARKYTGACAGVPRYAALLAMQIKRISTEKAPGMEDFNETPGLNLGPIALVGHSMGGLISRFAIQYNLFGVADCVGRLMTLATPHGGARHASPARILRFIPGMSQDDVTFLTPRWVNSNMGGMKPKPKLGKLADSDVFCLVGTRREGYYPLARRLARTDGIVHQDEAYLEGYPYAFVYNTHSGEHGIRENHDGYQTMRRFLFGNIRVTLRLVDIDLKKADKFKARDRFFFQFFVKPRGINAHLNEISERAENQPRPRIMSEVKQAVKGGRFVLYDGFADAAAIVAPSDRAISGVAVDVKDLPHLQLEYLSFLFDPWVGGKQIGAGYAMIPLQSGQTSMDLDDGTFRAILQVTVAPR